MTDERSKKVIQNTRMFRKVRGWSVRQFAAQVNASGMADVSGNAIYNMESGRKTSVSVDELFAFAHVLNVPTQRLAEGPGCETCSDSPPAGFACLNCGKKGDE